MKHLTGILILTIVFFAGKSTAQESSEGYMPPLVKLVSFQSDLFQPAIIENTDDSLDSNDIFMIDLLVFCHPDVLYPLHSHIKNNFKNIVFPFLSPKVKTLIDLPPPVFFS
ncbi:MAG: hypothetical protein JXR31_02080 [Prolixibacteraceae bacterium]|nr:hypothetical protein [Prolixibacteraceae bacterium]MBN2773009.1 hypothetical protein [Prolixibacteraceae bacterium]